MKDRETKIKETEKELPFANSLPKSSGTGSSILSYVSGLSI